MSDTSELIEAIKNGDGEEVGSLLDDRPQLASATTAEGISVLLLACYYGRMDMAEAIEARRQDLDIFEAVALDREVRVRSLLSSKPALAGALAPDGFTALGFAAFFGRPNLLGPLLAAGAEVNAPSQNPMKVHPIHSAAANHDADVSLSMVKVLVAAGADVNVVQQGGVTPLHQAAAHGRNDLVQFLLASGADQDAKTDDGKTALAFAKERGHEDTAAILSSSGG